MELRFNSHFDLVIQVFYIFVFMLCFVFVLCIVRNGFCPTVAWINREEANRITDVYHFLLSFNTKIVEIHNRNVKTVMNESVYI